MNRRQGAKLRVQAITDLLRGLVTKVRLRLPVARTGNRRRFGFGRKAATTAPHAPRTTPTTAAAALASRAPSAGSRMRMSLANRLRHLRTFLAWAAPLGVAIAAFALPVIGGRAYEYVMSSGYFHVHEVLVDGASRIQRPEVLEIAGIVPGTHLLDADLAAMEARLVANPWIRSARVDRILPDTLVVHLVEHRPTAFLAAGELYLVDENATPFMIAPIALDLALPVITGLSPETLTDPKETHVVHHALTGALNVARMWEDQGLAARYPLGEIRIDGPRGYVVVVEAQNHEGIGTGRPVEIVLGRGPFTEKLFRLEWVLEHLHAQGKAPEYVLLDLFDGGASAQGGEVLGGARVIVKAEVGLDDGAPSPAAAATAPAPAAPPVAPDVHEPEPVIAPGAGADDEGPDGPASEILPLSGGRPAAQPGLEE